MKKSKKFVLAGLALLAAIIMVLLPLAGCKTDVDTSSPEQEQPGDSNTNSSGGGDTVNGNNDNDASVITTSDPAAFIDGITAAGTYTLVATNECTDTVAIKEALWALASRLPGTRIHLDLGQSGITSIGYSAFEGCSSLASVTFAEGSRLGMIGDDAFNGCRSLVSVEIPSSVTSIGNSAFGGCLKLSTVKVEAETPPALGTNVFFTHLDLKIQVPRSSEGYYTSAENWSAYKIEAITP